MALERYKDYLLMSQPKPDNAAASWYPFAVVCWAKDGNRHVHRIEGLDRLAFPNEEEATLYGLTVARAWVNDKP